MSDEMTDEWPLHLSASSNQLPRPTAAAIEDMHAVCGLSTRPSCVSALVSHLSHSGPDTNSHVSPILSADCSEADHVISQDKRATYVANYRRRTRATPPMPSHPHVVIRESGLLEASQCSEDEETSPPSLSSPHVTHHPDKTTTACMYENSQK